jgi:hypothetical protein
MNYNGEVTDKILSGYYGGYLSGDSWRLSSGIMSYTEETDRYIITNHSGSVYTCIKDWEGCSSLMHEKLFSWQKDVKAAMEKDTGKIYKIDVISATDLNSHGR